MAYPLRDIKRRSVQALAPLIGIALMGYFAYHSIHGDRGLLAWVELTKKLEMAQSNLNDLKSEREKIEQKVSGLRPESLNRDLLEQQVRDYLGYTHPDELVVILEETPASPPSDVSSEPENEKILED